MFHDINCSKTSDGIVSQSPGTCVDIRTFEMKLTFNSSGIKVGK